MKISQTKTLLKIVTILFTLNSVTASAAPRMIDLTLTREEPLCFQGAAQALERATTKMNRQAQHDCRNQRGALQPTKPSDVSISSVDRGGRCDTLIVSINYKCAVFE